MRTAYTDVYFDMDGVLADLDGALAESEGVPVERIQADRAFRAAAIEFRRKRMHIDHYLSLRPLHREAFERLFERLTAAGVRVHILTACDVADEQTRSVAASGKAMWVKHYLRSSEGNIASVLVVRTGTDKAAYAHPAALLVDDQPENTAGFRAAGGAAIDYTGAASLQQIYRRIED